MKNPEKFNYISAMVTNGIAFYLSFNFVGVYALWRLLFGNQDGIITAILKIAGYWVAMLVAVAVLLPSAVSLITALTAHKLYRKGNLKGYRVFMSICFAVMFMFSIFIALYSVISMEGILRVLLAGYSGIVTVISVMIAVNTFSKKIISDIKGE